MQGPSKDLGGIKNLHYGDRVYRREWGPVFSNRYHKRVPLQLHRQIATWRLFEISKKARGSEEIWSWMPKVDGDSNKQVAMKKLKFFQSIIK